MTFVPLSPIPLKDRTTMIFLQYGQIDVLDGAFVLIDKYSAAIFLIPICISFDTAEKRRYATYLILNRRFSFEF